MKHFLLFLIVGILPVTAHAQVAPGGPPAVGVVRAERQQITQADEFIGHIQSIGRVALVARVTAVSAGLSGREASHIGFLDLVFAGRTQGGNRRFVPASHGMAA
jgi:hypothetical protein